MDEDCHCAFHASAAAAIALPIRMVVGKERSLYIKAGLVERMEGKYNCPFCPKRYRFKHSLKDHINKHTGNRPHQCKHCSLRFIHLSSLCAHVRRRHSQVDDKMHCVRYLFVIDSFIGVACISSAKVPKKYTWRCRLPDRASWRRRPGCRRRLSLLRSLAGMQASELLALYSETLAQCFLEMTSDWKIKTKLMPPRNSNIARPLSCVPYYD